MRKLKFLAVGFAAALLAALPVAGFAGEPQGIVAGEDAAGVEVQIGEPAALEDTGISLQWSSAASDDYCYIKGTFDYKEASYQKVLVNKHREANGASPLVMDADLQSAAMQRAAEIALYFSHTRPNGTKWSTITNGAYGENIAMGGFGSSDAAAENVTEKWMNSDGHRANILKSSYTTIGVGCFRIGNVSYWVELFGTARKSETYANAGVGTATTKVDYSHSLVPYDGSGFNLNMRQEDPEPLEPGETYELAVGIQNPEFTYYYTSTEAHGYTWKSSNPAAFTVDNGIVNVSSGAQVGAISTITATSPGGRSWSKEFIVKSNVVSVTGVRLNRTSLSLDTGDTAVLTATVSPSNATDKGVSWSSSNTGVATVDSSGNVRAVGAGTAVIAVRTDDGSYTAKCTVTVKSDVKVERISLSPSTLTLGKNSTYKLTYTISPSNAENKGVTWKSSDSSIARVDSTGKVTAVSVGKATITVTTADGGKTASCTVTVKGPAVTGVSLDRTALTLNKGDIRTLKATVYPTDAENREVGWTSSNSAIARVDSSGKVIAVSAGKATITATTRDGGKTATCVITVKGSAVTGVSLDRTSLVLGKGESYTLKATVAPTDAENKEVTWKSTDSSIARVDSNGNVTAVASGKVTITATTDDGKTASCTVTVKGPAVTGVSLDKTTLSLGKGESYTLKATVVPVDAENKKVTWKSSDNKVATVDANGRVTAIASGSATITATTDDGGKTATCTVSVAGAVSGVTLDKTSLSLDKGESYTLKATVTPADAENKKVTWRSSDTKVATVDADGRVTAVAPGSATITVTTVDGNKTATCAVSVAGAVSGVTLDKTELALKVDESTVLKATVLPENALNKKVTWTSSDTKVATVDANGKVTAVAPGTATITVTTEDGNKTATCTVKVGDQLVVTFVTNGGSAVKSQLVDEGERVVRPADPTRAYYRFTGWFADASLKTAYDFSTPVTTDLTLYAGWAGYSPYRGFTDVVSDDWYVTCDLFDYTIDHRFMSGYSGTTLFGPYDTITRAQVICVLWNMAGQPSAGSVENFSDNRDATAYYYDAVRWARSAGVANGYAGSNLFNPNGNVSRQELATFLYNYANKVAKLDTSSDMGAASQISGWSTVDAYAKPAIAWAVDHGLMSGVDTSSGPQLRPNDTAWRASMATMSATFHRDVIGA